MTTTRALLLTIAVGMTACAAPTEVPVIAGSDEPEVFDDRFLGLEPPAEEAVVFAPGVVSVEGRYEYALSIHPSGKRLLFTVEAPDQGASVYQIRLGDCGWTSPVQLDLTAGARKNEMEAFFTPDGTGVFFAPFTKGMDVRIWSAEVTPSGFSNPGPLEGPIAEYPTFFPVQATDRSLYHTNLAERTVFRAVLDEGRVVSTEPVGLGPVGHAFPSPDERFMLVDSASLDSKDQRDIYVSFRRDDGRWGTPQPLGPEVNTDYSETCPTLSPDGEFIFFSRYNEPGGLSDIYWVSSTVIERSAPS